MTRRALRSVLFSTALFAFAPSIAHAQTSNDEAITALKQSADDLMHQLHFREALEKYEAALKLGGGAAIHYNRARALQGLGDYPRALDALEEFVRTSTPDLRARVPRLDDLIADLHAHVAVVTITCNVPGATVRVRHELVGSTPIAVPIRLSTGPALVEVEAQGHRTFTKQLDLASGESSIDTALDVGTSAEPPPVTPIITTTPTPWRPVAFMVGGVGVASLAAGGIFGGAAIAKKSELDSHCPNKSCDAVGAQMRSDAYTMASLSTAFLIAGGVLAAASVVMVFALPARVSRRTGLVPMLGPGAVGLAGTF